MKRLYILFSILIIASMLIAACGRGEETPPPEPTEAPVAVEQPTQAPEEPTQAPEEPAEAVTCTDEWGVVTVKAGDPIKLGFAAGLSGAGIDVLGIDEQRGAELAVADVGEVFPGFPLELQVEDSQCSGEGGTAVANKFVADPEVVAVVGHMCSSSCIPASDIYDQNNYTMLSPSCTAVAFTARGLSSANRVVWNDAIQGPAAAQFILESLGLTQVATIHDGSPYGEGLVNEMAGAFVEMGGEVVAQEAVNVGDTDMRPLLTKIKSANPQLIYFGGFPAEGAFLASQRADVGMEDVVFMGADGIRATAYIEASGDAAEGTYASAANPAEAGPGMPDFLAAYEATYGEQPPAPFHAHAYDAVRVYAEVIKQIGQITPEGDLCIGRKALNDALHSFTGYQGLSGMISCQENGDCGTGTVSFAEAKEGAWVDIPAAGEMVEEAPEELVAGGTLIFAQSADAGTLDPALETSGNSLAPAYHIYEGLTDFEPGTTTPLPRLAESWEASEDGLEWTFKLREGVTFHDGTPFNADAVVFNFERWWDTENPYNLGADQFIYWDYMFQGFKGDENSVVAGIEKVDDMTFKLLLNRPNASLLNTLAMENFRFASPTAVMEQGENYGTAEGKAIGTGPFMVEDWAKEDRLTLARYDEYWGEKPTLEKIVYRVIPDTSAAFLALQAGDIDMLSLWASPGPDDIAVAKEDPNLQVIYNPAFNVGYLGLNHAKEWLQNLNVRLALAHAIDKQAIVDSLYPGDAEPAKEFQPPSLWGYNEGIEDYPYDPELAAEYLQAAIDEGVEIPDPAVFYVMPVSRAYYPQPQPTGELIQAFLADVGINVEIQSPAWPDPYLSDLEEDGTKHDLFMLGWVGDNGDPDNFLCVFFCGGDTTFNNDGQGGGLPPDEEIAQLLRDAVAETDFETRKAAYEQINQLLHDRVISVPIVHRTPPTLLRANIEGYVPSPVREVLTYLTKN